MRSHILSRGGTILVFLAALAFALPLLLHAQTDLEIAVREALAEDPDTFALSNEQFEGLVSAIVEEASARGLTVEDLQEPAIEALVAESEEAPPISFGALSTNTKAVLLFALLIAFLLGVFLLGRWLRTPPASPQ